MDYSDLVNDVVMDCPGVPYPLVIRAIREAVRRFCQETTIYRKVLASSDMSYANNVYTITVPAGTEIISVVSPISVDIGDTYTVYTYSNGVHQYTSTDSVALLVGYTLLSSTTANNLTYTVYTYADGLGNFYNSLDAAPITGFTLQTSVVVSSSWQTTNHAIGRSAQWLDAKYPGWRSAVSTVQVDYFVMLSPNTFMLTPDSGTDRRSNMTATILLKPDRVTTTLDDDIGNRWFDDLVAGAKMYLMVMPKTSWENPQLAAMFTAKYEAAIASAKNYIATGYRHPHTADGTGRVRSYFK